MKVMEDRPPLQDVIYGLGTLGRKGAAESAAPFEAVLQEKNLVNTRETLNKLLERINEQGELIAHRRDINDIRKYRELVTDFLNEAMRSTYHTNKEGTFDARGRFKEYSIVKKVNVELEKLTCQVLSDQKENLIILEQLGTIRGLLIDLMI